MNNIFILLGPTGSGKSNLSYQLADDFDFEIINADLFSIYKYLNIGTAKPTKEKFEAYKHFLFDKLNPDESYNVSTYCLDALQSITNIIKRGKVPLIVGGSMMYVYQLLNGLTHQYNLLDSDLDLIKFIQKKYDNKSILKSIRNYNIELINKIDINDSYRVEKLLERLISNKKSTEHKFNGLCNDKNFNICTMFIDVNDRATLKESIKKRTQGMIKKGLIKEVDELKRKFKLSDKNQSMKAIGYKETLQYLDKKISRDDLISLIILSTQRLAKRQMTWKNKFNISYPITYSEYNYVKLSKYISQILK